MDTDTKDWIRNASDELAAKAGCRFDVARAQHVIDFATAHLRLYEGEYAGDALEPRDWQREAAMRLFGWVKWSAKWERWVRRFRAASIWVPKKNKKSPTLAWWGLYLFAADGEPGQKVFSCAKDGKHAREISHRHAWEMARSSPALADECRFYKLTKTIEHEPTRSTYSVLCSDNAASQKATEGINGSLVVDETHVVDRQFMRRVSRAGISRSEPLHIEVSTAGKDPDSYGKERYDRGRLVASGDVLDERLLFIDYSAPQELTDDELAADPLAIGEAANPAWGHTVDPEEYLADYETSKRSIAELADFKMYRLNIWQRAANPWLKGGDWHKCGESYGLDWFYGRDVWTALDKSKTRDMSALVLVARDGDAYRQWPVFWLPEQTAEDNDHLVSFTEWSHAGHLQLIPGEVIADQYLYDVFADVATRCRVQGVWYDKTYAHDLTLRFEDELGVERIEFPQTSVHFAGPIDDYERCVIEGALRHPNNPVLNWQAGHCSVRSDSKGRRTLVKPETGDIKKIDGMVAGVMALYGALNAPPAAPSVYESRGVLTV